MNATIAAPAAEVAIFGAYTVQNPSSGAHRTYEIGYFKAADRYTVKLMTGSDNNSDFTPFATLDTAGKAVRPFAKKSAPFVDATEATKWAFHARIVQDFLFNSQRQFPGLLVTPEMKCRRCQRRLTNPVSLDTGIGPECIKK